MPPDKRRRTRVQASFTVELEMQNIIVSAVTVNLSLKGILCEPVDGFAPGDLCIVHIILSKDVRICINGSVVRSDEKGVAVDFLDMDDESFTHLRKLVQYNSEDADSIDRELISPAFDS
ncbi:PilZ domain-containing protein [Maridesulfovibrio bastinii]|jgi:hypothetical protein|uniref:PilZ domain-containing protein n=1 Tax=Maridesulfovibrio bastinii TaxID=47157 RepID=UPI00042923BA|nr:PilZ domain-containing protein [Maridesulfovibrio bastinii]